jgi:hypothetical protein
MERNMPLTLPLSVKLNKWTSKRFILGKIKLLLLKIRYHFLKLIK